MVAAKEVLHMSTTQAGAYALRFKQVFDYIDQHLDEALNVDQLSQVAHFSKFHFHRQFSQYCGITVSRYITLMRLKRASYRLAFNPLERIIDIALDAGFENPESFSRAFKHVFGQTPSAFRRKPAWAEWSAKFESSTRKAKEKVDTMEVRIVSVEPSLVAVLEHRGNPALLNDTAGRFIEWRRSSGLSPVDASKTYGIAHDNPDTTAPEDFRFDICGSVAEPVPANPQGVVTKEIPGGRCAVVRHMGSTDCVGESVYYLYRQWLPESGEELRDFPVYFHYLNVKLDTPEHELRTDVYLPLK
jgi:AraC family transcriptional regulator